MGHLLPFAAVLLFLPAAGAQAQTPAGGRAIEIWHGDRQRVGHLGDAQDDFNLMGRVRPWRDVDTLTWKLEKGGEFPLSFRAFRRLIAEGDFNADIPVGRLVPGPNVVTITARFRDGQELTRSMTLVKESGSRPLPVTIRWKQVLDPQDVGQYVDGLWGVDETGLRTRQTGYDRVFLIGERTWQDYEVRTSVTIHRVDSETSSLSGGNGLGVILRFAGHVTGGPRFFPSGQPKWGYQPFGSIGWLRWNQKAPEEMPNLQFYPGGLDRWKNLRPYGVRLGRPYAMVYRCETLPDAPSGEGVTRYSFKVWPAGEPEPGEWSWQEVQTSSMALRRGGVARLAHHVDASFGDVEILALPKR